MSDEPRWVDRLIAYVLRGGVTISVIVVLAGLIITFVHHREYFRSRPALGALTNPGASYPSTIGSVVEGVREGHGQAIVTLGLLLLIATPVAAFRGSVELTVGGVVSRATPVVKLQTKLAASALPARFLAPGLILAVYTVLGARLPRGVNVAITPS